MPILKGPGNIRKNVTELVNMPVRSAARKKAIITIAKKNNISRPEAQFRQAIRIAQSASRKT